MDTLYCPVCIPLKFIYFLLHTAFFLSLLEAASCSFLINENVFN